MTHFLIFQLLEAIIGKELIAINLAKRFILEEKVDPKLLITIAMEYTVYLLKENLMNNSFAQIVNDMELW